MDSQEPETLATVGEFATIGRITSGREQPRSTLLGPGDDGAVVAAGKGSVVASTDVLVESVHFRLDWSAAEFVGRKAAAVNMSDIAAMGARPTALLVSVAAPSDTASAVLDDLADGLWAEAGSAGAGVVGGDLSSGPALIVSVTALGDLDGRPPVTRSGAQPGDVVAVCGRLGWSAAGFAVLARGFRSPVSVVNAHRCPEPPYRQGPVAAEAGATSMIDVSDGLLADMGHVAEASGVAIDLSSQRLTPDQRLREVASALGKDAAAWVLTGGEDHALAATFPSAAEVPEGWRLIGAVGKGHGVTVDGAAYEGDQGWTHYR